MIDKLQDKFIVINKKHLEELSEVYTKSCINGNPKINEGDKLIHPEIERFLLRLKGVRSQYLGMMKKPLNQKYIVCNQDEPYAEEVARIILEGENKKPKTIDDIEFEPIDLDVYGKYIVDDEIPISDEEFTKRLNKYKSIPE